MANTQPITDPEKHPHDSRSEQSEDEITVSSNKDRLAENMPDPKIVDFDGPDDLENPMNWTATKKFAAIFTVSIITFLSPLTSTIISPGTAKVMKEFHSTSEILASFVTTVFLIGYAFGPIVIAPMSELYGRAIMYQTCGLIFLVFNIACAKAPNLAALIVFRFFAGIAGSCPVTIGAGSIADMIPHEKRGAAMAGWVLGPLLGPSIGPIIGGYLTPAKGWRWNFWVLSILVGATLILTFVFIRESCAYVILDRKTKRLRKETGNQNLRSALDTGKTHNQLFAFSIFRPLKMLFLSPIVFLLSLYEAVIYAYLYLCYTTFPRIFETQYGFSSGASGLVFLGTGVGSLLGLVICGALLDPVVKYLVKKNGGDPRPEYRLPALAVGGIIVPVGLFMYGWTAEHHNHWIVPIIGTGFLGVGVVVVFMGITTYLVDAYITHAASANAASTIFRALMGAFLPLAGNSMYNALGVGWGTSVLGFIAIAFIPLPFLFYIYGHRIRESKCFRVEF